MLACPIGSRTSDQLFYPTLCHFKLLMGISVPDSDCTMRSKRITLKSFPQNYAHSLQNQNTDPALYFTYTIYMRITYADQVGEHNSK